jgi:Uma2 family endonuclease
MSTQSAVRGWTYEEFARLPDDGNRYEVIAGDLYVTPAPGTPHQIAHARFFTELRVFATNQHGLGEVLSAPLDVLFAEGDYLQPDILFIRAEHQDFQTKRGIEGPPDLVVEVLSPATSKQDRGIKRERYALYGVPEYWLIDAERGRVEVYRLQEDPDRSTVVTDWLRWEPVEGGPVLVLNVAQLLAGLG